MTPTRQSFCRLLQTARGASSSLPSNKLLPCFPLKAQHLGSTISTPTDFHSNLCNMIRRAKHRVHLASLYVGTGNGDEEREFLEALASIDSNVQVSILLDESRATRPVKHNDRSTTSSAEAVHKCLRPNSQSGLYLFPALPEPRRSLLPSPLNEIAGVFHIKAYVIDDNLILSGANLSQEYFTDRQDRYLWFMNGGGGLVEFYCKLVQVLCQYSFRYRDQSWKRCTKEQFLKSLETLLDGSMDADPCNPTESNDATKDVLAYAIPTFQAPDGFFSQTSTFPMDALLTQRLLLTAHESNESTTIQLASAYLNPTPNLTSILARFQHLHLLTAGYKSHGFAPRPGQPPRRGDWVPSIFSALYAELEEKLPHANMLYYERDGWTFHAKGLWITQDNVLMAAIVGSGNYGARSEVIDIESNTILVFPSAQSELQSRLEEEWDTMTQHAHEGHAIEFPETSWRVKAALPIVRDFF